MLMTYKGRQDVVRQQLFRLLMHSAGVVVCARDHDAEVE